MATALSEEEFHRMQLQLLELRTINYELEGKCKKLERELIESQEKIEILDKDLSRATKAINKSKKAKETELLLHENESLQRKLLSQEDEFRLQNQTLMTELSTLITANEKLESHCRELEEAVVAAKAPQKLSLPLENSGEQIQHLQAQNVALQKNLTATQEKYEKELSSLQEKLNFFTRSEDVQDRLSPAGSEDMGEETRKVEGQAAEDDVTQGTAVTGVAGQKQNSMQELIEQLKELQLSLDTELVEKQLVKEKFALNESKLREQVAVLQEEVEKLGERLKKKQESFLLVQTEKETIFEENRIKIDELQAARERDQKYYQEQITKLQQEVEKAKQAQESVKTSSEEYVQGLKRKMEELQKQVNAANIVGNHQLQEQSNKYEFQIKDLKTQVASLMHKNEDLYVQLQASQHASEETVGQLQAAQHERDSQIQALQEVSKIAEKRKLLLDELAIKYQKEYDSHRQQVKQMEEKHQTEIYALQQDIHQLMDRIQDLSKQQSLVEDLQGRVRSLEDTKGWLERRLKETEAEVSRLHTELQETTAELLVQHKAEVCTLKEIHMQEIKLIQEDGNQRTKEWESKKTDLQEEIVRLKEAVASLTQNISDGVYEKKLHEKKGLTVLKDLKRQLHAERKRAEKLQERLQEILSDSKNKSMEDLFHPADPGDLSQGDASSVSSWSTGASGLGKDSTASGPQSPTVNSHSFVSSNAESGNEYAELLQRLARIQQEKWALEEKVNHLETSTACMADDLLQKTAIIEHYVMSTHSGKRASHHMEDSKLSLKKVMDMVKVGDHSELHEMNKKLQLMLEETLTKNMHLQQDLEMMSQEVVRLSKISVHMLPADTLRSEKGILQSRDRVSTCTQTENIEGSTDAQIENIEGSTVTQIERLDSFTDTSINAQINSHTHIVIDTLVVDTKPLTLKQEVSSDTDTKPLTLKQEVSSDTDTKPLTLKQEVSSDTDTKPLTLKREVSSDTDTKPPTLKQEVSSEINNQVSHGAQVTEVIEMVTVQRSILEEVIEEPSLPMAASVSQSFDEANT